MRKVGIFGGTFDPFTSAHLEIVKQVLEQKLVDVVYVCPTIVVWHRKEYVPWLSDEQKLEVIRMMLKSDPLTYSRAMVDDEDLAMRRICSGNGFLVDKYVKEHRFIDTLMRIKARRDEDDELWPIVGPDEYENFENWYAYDSVLKLSAGLLVITDEDGNGRGGRPVYAKDGNPLFKSVRPVKIEKRFMGVSATKKREEFRELGWRAYLNTALRDAAGGKLGATVLHTPIFDVMKGAKTASGLEPILVAAPDWVMVIAEQSGKFLVERQYRYGGGCCVKEFPCGMVEPGEDPRAAAARELAEETGFLVADVFLQELGVMNPNPAFMTNKMHLYYVDLDAAKAETVNRRLDPHEEISYDFVDKAEFKNETTAGCRDGTVVPAMLMSALWLYDKTGH